MATNASVDILAAAFAAPYGPLTRVTDLDSYAISDPDNEQIVLEFTTGASAPAIGASFTVNLTAEQLADSDWAEELIRDQIGVAALGFDLIDRIDTWNTAAAAVVLPVTVDELQTLLQQGRTLFPELAGY